MTLKQLDKVTAVFHPMNVDDLHADVTQFIGYRGLWQAAWIIEEGPYEGQWAFKSVESDGPHRWVPACDLVIEQDNYA